MKSARRRAGFTLIELMIVVAIIGILAAVAIPKFANMVNKSREATAKYGLGALRSAMSLYYADNLVYPAAGSFQAVVVGRYIEKVPAILLPPPAAHDRQDTVVDYPGAFTDLGGWFYDGTGSAGRVFVDCTHADLQGRTWSSW